ncbi:MAG: hypothetical protein M1826_003034 [Phylliscum demangeonii]|nr:MAG: hypothetical protein M1826_003034 [Phylliscum demangeonii]
MAEQLRILLVGNGGREHALCWKLSQSPRVARIYVVPGNGGTARCSVKTSNVPDLQAGDFPGLVAFAKKHAVNLVVPGPEAPLVDGIADACRSEGLRCFGPSRAAARMEGSKVFAKDFMRRHKIPTASYRTFDDYHAARRYLDAVDHDVVIKASGLAAGKGVIIPTTREEAHAALKDIMLAKEFGSAGDEVVIEELLTGEELSILAFSDGYTIKPLPPAQDHKRIFDGDQGPNTGAFPFVGILFTGLMMTASGPKVLEYNVRFGDPETQTLLPLLTPETDLAELMLASTDDVILFHAGTVLDDSVLRTSGGRVIAATATADTLEAAVEKAYRGVQCIKFEKMYIRHDIAHRALSRSPPSEPSLTYAAAGVSVDAGNSLVERIKSAVRSTKRPGADAEIGGFGGTFDLPAAGYENGPILIGAIDGVGTKLKIAQAVGVEDSIGIDLVAMNVNDLVVQGAEPLFFLDCYSCSKLDEDQAARFVQGVATGCRQAGCALIGGETAEMPGLYSGSDYDVVGAAIGAVRSRDQVMPYTQRMRAGNTLLGLASSGVHSNGFSLVRKIVERQGLSFDGPTPWNEGDTVGKSLLTPTRIYVRSLLALAQKGVLLGMAHITGGGLTDNIPRMLPPELAAEVDVGSWTLPPVFAWLKQAGKVEAAEMARTFNVGIGMVLVVSEGDVDAVIEALEGAGESVFRGVS